MQVFSIIVLSFLSLLLIVLGIYLILVRIMFHRCFGHQKNTEKRLNKKLLETYKIDLDWWKKQKREELVIVSEDDLKLHAFYLNKNAENTAILVHGYRCDYQEMASYAKMFFSMGYNVLVTVNRGHGKSEGFIGMGYLDRKDILLWIKILTEKNPEVKIVLFGLSMGGSAVCMTAGENLPLNVRGAISDGGFENVYNQISQVFKSSNSKFKTKLLNIFCNYMKRVYDFDLKGTDAGKSLENAHVPIMLIHGKNDVYVPVENAENLLKKIGENKKDIYLVENAGHAMCYATNSLKYEFKLREFLKKWEM